MGVMVMAAHNAMARPWSSSSLRGGSDMLAIVGMVKEGQVVVGVAMSSCRWSRGANGTGDGAGSHVSIELVNRDAGFSDFSASPPSLPPLLPYLPPSFPPSLSASLLPLQVSLYFAVPSAICRSNVVV